MGFKTTNEMKSAKTSQSAEIIAFVRGDCSVKGGEGKGACTARPSCVTNS